MRAATATCPQDEVRHVAQPQDSEAEVGLSHDEVNTEAANVIVVVSRHNPDIRSNVAQRNISLVPSFSGNISLFLNQIRKRKARAERLNDEAMRSVAGTVTNQFWINLSWPDSSSGSQTL